jgi:hypothetical protein
MFVQSFGSSGPGPALTHCRQQQRELRRNYHACVALLYNVAAARLLLEVPYDCLMPALMRSCLPMLASATMRQGQVGPETSRARWPVGQDSVEPVAWIPKRKEGQK